MRLPRKGGAFRPVSGARGESAADVFMRPEEDGILLGVFNYSLSEERHMDIPVEKLGLSAEECYMVRILWNKRETEVRGRLYSCELRYLRSLRYCVSKKGRIETEKNIPA